MSDTSPEAKTILQSSEVDLQTLTHMYEAEKQKREKIEQTIRVLTQKHLVADKDSRYWQQKALSLQMDLSLAQYDIEELKGTRKIKSVDAVNKLKQKYEILEDLLEQEFDYSYDTLLDGLVERYQLKLEHQEVVYKAEIDEKEAVNERIRDVVDRLNEKLDFEKTEDKITENILNLRDTNSMLRLIYHAQFKVNQKILAPHLAKKKDENGSESGNSTNSNEELNVPMFPMMQPQMMGPPMMSSQMMMGMNPMMQAQLMNMQLPPQPVKEQAKRKQSAPTEPNEAKKIERED